MATKVRNTVKNGSESREETGPRSAAYFDRGIRDSGDAIAVSLVVCGDMVSGRLTGPIGTAVAANVRNVIKLAELSVKFGQGEGAQRVLPLSR